MPSYAESLRRDISRALFIETQEKRAPKRKPKKVGKPPRGTLFAIRNKRLAIREGAMQLLQLVLTYTKETTGETKKYVVAPYSYRYRRLKTGIKKMLFAFDMDDKHIKGFVIRNIRNVAVTDRTFRPKWPVEISVWLVMLGLLWVG